MGYFQLELFVRYELKLSVAKNTFSFFFGNTFSLATFGALLPQKEQKELLCNPAWGNDEQQLSSVRGRHQVQIAETQCRLASRGNVLADKSLASKVYPGFKHQFSNVIDIPSLRTPCPGKALLTLRQDGPSSHRSTSPREFMTPEKEMRMDLP